MSRAYSVRSGSTRSAVPAHAYPGRGAVASVPADWERALDVAVSIVALVSLAPVIVATALLVKTTSRGPVFYRQERVGIDRRYRERRRAREFPVGDCRRLQQRRAVVGFGRPFTVHKFRSMVVDAERETGPRCARRNDPRVTAVGRFLRRSRIDEIPQFVNVLRGEMGIVGPRPERAYFIKRIETELPGFRLRVRTKPGITGLAQVALGYTHTAEDARRKLELDLEYIRGRSAGMYVKILLRTVHVVLTGKGAC